MFLWGYIFSFEFFFDIYGYVLGSMYFEFGKLIVVFESNIVLVS